MFDPDGLNVWSDQQLVGYLWRNSQGLIGFRYEQVWLAQGEFAISHTLPLQHLLRWQAFNVLAGNSDGHAKNLSLLHQANGEVRLAPFYDLVCTRAIERIDYRLAFSVGDEKNPGIMTLKHWDIWQTSVDCVLISSGIRFRVLLKGCWRTYSQ